LLVDVLHRRDQRAVLHLRGGRRHGRVHEPQRVVLEHACRLALSIAHDRATRDILGRARDARELQSEAVGERHVAVEPVDPHRVIRRHRIDPLARWQLAAPEAVVPVTASDPRACRHGCRERLDPCNELLARARIAQLYGREAEAAFSEVHVCIGEARHDQPAAGIDDLLGVRFASVLIRADQCERRAVDDQCLRPRLGVVAGPDTCVDDCHGAGLCRSGRGLLGATDDE
jgi:hypothetical protein